MPWLRRFSRWPKQQGLGFNIGPVYVAFVADQVALGQVPFEYLDLPLYQSTNQCSVPVADTGLEFRSGGRYFVPML